MGASRISVAVDGSGNLYLADGPNNRCRLIAPDGIITTIAGNGSSNFSGDGGPAIDAGTPGEDDCVPDSAGNLYLPNVSRVRMINTAGIITTIIGTGVSGFSGDGGPAASAALAFPTGVAVDASGNLFIADNGNNRIRKVSAGGIISTVAGNGNYGFSGDGGPAA